MHYQIRTLKYRCHSGTDYLFEFYVRTPHFKWILEKSNKEMQSEKLIKPRKQECTTPHLPIIHLPGDKF